MSNQDWSDDDDDIEAEQIHEPEEREQLAYIPTIQYYHKTYAPTGGMEDRKAAHVFKNFESQEKLRRLQNELMTIKNGQVSEVICDRVIGKRRKGKYESYQNWARLMLLWLSGPRQ